VQHTLQRRDAHRWTRDKVPISPATTLATAHSVAVEPVLRWHGDELVLVHDVPCDWCIPTSHVNVGATATGRERATSLFVSVLYR
jgi:hypothetical protein